MITRRHVNRWFLWAGLVLGPLGLVGYAASAYGSYTYVWGKSGGYGDRRISIGRGGIAVHWVATQGQKFLAAGAFVTPSQLRDEHWRWLPTAGAEPDLMNPTLSIGYAVIPFWAPVLIGAGCCYLLLPPTYPKGRCGKCGYDVSALPAGTDGSLKCPECGTNCG